MLYFLKTLGKTKEIGEGQMFKAGAQTKLYKCNLFMKLPRGWQVLNANTYLHASPMTSSHLSLNFENLVLTTN